MTTRPQDIKIVWDYDVPQPMLAVATKRTTDMISFYGRNIRSLGIETLCASCYLQGVRDCLDHVDTVAKPTWTDYEI